MSAPVRLDVPSQRHTGISYVESGSQTSVVFGTWRAQPIAHRLHHERRGETLCGRDLWHHDDEGRVRYDIGPRGTWLPLRHALRFARPCGVCWP